MFNVVPLSVFIFFQDQESDAKTFVTNSISRIATSTNVKEAVKSTDLVVEAIVEKIDVKHKLFSDLDSVSWNFFI